MAKPLVVMKYKDKFLACRAFGHNLRRAFHREPGVRRITIRHACQDCGWARVDIVHLDTGGVMDRSYEYPDGYLITEVGTVSRDIWRREFLRRQR